VFPYFPSLISSVALCAVLFELRVLFCVKCIISVLCLIIVPLLLGKNQSAVQINKQINNNNNNNNNNCLEPGDSCNSIYVKMNVIVQSLERKINNVSSTGYLWLSELLIRTGNRSWESLSWVTYLCIRFILQERATSTAVEVISNHVPYCGGPRFESIILETGCHYQDTVSLSSIIKFWGNYLNGKQTLRKVGNSYTVLEITLKRRDGFGGNGVNGRILLK
jgi:hypothetical protein